MKLDVAILTLPALLALLFLHLRGGGMAYAPSDLARGAAVLWAVVGTGAAITLCRRASDGVSWLVLRALGVAAIVTGVCLFWCAWPVTAVERAGRLDRSTAEPDPASLEIAVLELAGETPPPAGAAEAFLALGVYREKRVRHPGTALMLLGLARHELLAFASPADLEARCRRHLEAPAAPAAEIDVADAKVFDAAAQALLAADRVAAQRLLDALGRTPAAWDAARAHLLAAKALAVLGDGPGARLERAIALAAKPDAGEAARLDVAAELAALAQAHLEKAGQHDAAGRAVEAAHALEDVLRCDASKLPDPRFRENVGAVVEQDLARIGPFVKPRRALASILLSRDRQQQLDVFTANARLVAIAHTCSLLDRASQGTAALDLVDRRFVDAYGEHRIKWLRGALEKR